MPGRIPLPKPYTISSLLGGHLRYRVVIAKAATGWCGDGCGNWLVWGWVSQLVGVGMDVMANIAFMFKQIMIVGHRASMIITTRNFYSNEHHAKGNLRPRPPMTSIATSLIGSEAPPVAKAFVGENLLRMSFLTDESQTLSSSNLSLHPWPRCKLCKCR